MIRFQPQRVMHTLRLHDERSIELSIKVCLGILIALAFIVRISLIHFQNADYTIFSQWYDFAKVHGIHVFKYTYEQGFTNYNPPYSYFLYIATLLPVPKIVAIKGLLALFDIILAVSVYCVVKIVKPKSYTALIAAITVLFLPTVLITGVFWGQFDQLYVAFMLFSLYFALRNKSSQAWSMFGVAVAVKFQAIFFLPVLGILIFRRIKWYDSIWAVGTFLLVTLPPMLAGRSLYSLLDIYPAQAKLFNGQLTLNAPNMYQWFPNSAFPYLDHAGIVLGIVVSLFILLISLMYHKFSKEELLISTSLVLYVVPFFLPAMHERYFFPAGVMSLILAFAYPKFMYAVIAAVMQVVTLFSYSPFLFHTEPIPMTVLALVVLGIICMLSRDFVGRPIANASNG